VDSSASVKPPIQFSVSNSGNQRLKRNKMKVLWKIMLVKTLGNVGYLKNSQ